jgi:hypothetical protein
LARYEATIPSSWTADDTFSYLADFSNAERWDPGVLLAERLDAGTVGPGSEFRLVVPLGARKLTLLYRVIRISREDRQVLLAASNGLMRVRDQISVTPSSPLAGDSLVTYWAEVRLRGPLVLLDPLLSRGFKATGGRAAASLADVLSSRRTDGASAPSEAS